MRLRVRRDEPIRTATRAYRDADRRSVRIIRDYLPTAEHAAGHRLGYRFGGYGLEADNWTVSLLGTYATTRALAGRAAVLDALATHLRHRGYSDRVIGTAAAIADAYRRTSR